MKTPSLKEFNIQFKDSSLKRNGRNINKEKLVQEVLHKYPSYSYDQVKSIVSGWEIDAENAAEFDIDDYITTQVEVSGIVNNFVIYVNNNGNKPQQLLHYKDGNELRLIGVLPIADKDITQVFRLYEPAKFTALRDILAPLLRPKISVTFDDMELVKVILNASNFYTNPKYIQTLDSPIKPICIEEESLSYCRLKYEKTNVVKLNPYLQDFLNRTSSHKQLCAILWLAFNGIKTPYVIYLYGSGGEGKSSFINMLCKMVRLFQSFEMDGIHNYFHMYGKALIILGENTDCFLMQNKAVKEITGNSQVSCQEKNKSSFTSTLEGLFIVDSNLKPKLIGEEYEFRRLRFFETKPANLNESNRINQEKFVQLLGSTPNDFLNYCRLCYEELGKNNLVEAGNEMQEQLRQLVDTYTVYNFNKLLTKMKLEISTGLTLNIEQFYNIYDAKNSNHKDRYFLDNFKTFLRLYHKVSEVDGKLIGIGVKDGKKKEEDPGF